MSIQAVFDSFRGILGITFPGETGLANQARPPRDEFIQFAKSLYPGLNQPKYGACRWNNGGFANKYIWVRLVPKEHINDLAAKKARDPQKAIPFTVSLFLHRSATDSSLMALTASIEPEHDYMDPEGFEALKSLFGSVPVGLEMRPESSWAGSKLTSQEEALKFATVTPAKEKGKKPKYHFVHIAQTIEEVPGKDDDYYRNALVPIFQKLVPLYWKAYDKLIELRTGQKPVRAESPVVEDAPSPVIEEKDPSPVIKKDPSFPLNLILQGPPGTGKTYRSIALASALVQGDYQQARYIVSGKAIPEDDYVSLQSRYKVELLSFEKNEMDQEKLKGHIAFTTFHQSYSYEEFVEGIFPEVKDGALSYSVKDGIFKAIADLANEHPNENYVLLIDEINRGNVSKILGDLISLLEGDKRLGEKHELRAVLPYSRTLWGVPSNLYLIGTMNTADRSIERLDTALMRRFAFFEIGPNPALLSDRLLGNGNDSLSLQELLEAMNERIKRYLGPERMIGHSYFMGLGKDVSREALAEVFRNRVLPTLLESALGDYRKVRKALGEKEGLKDGIVRALGEEDSYEDPVGYAYDYDALLRFETYRRIAEKDSSQEDEEG